MKLPCTESSAESRASVPSHHQGCAVMKRKHCRNMWLYHTGVYWVAYVCSKRFWLALKIMSWLVSKKQYTRKLSISAEGSHEVCCVLGLPINSFLLFLIRSDLLKWGICREGESETQGCTVAPVSADVGDTLQEFMRYAEALKQKRFECESCHDTLGSKECRLFLNYPMSHFWTSVLGHHNNVAFIRI